MAVYLSRSLGDERVPQTLRLSKHPCRLFHRLDYHARDTSSCAQTDSASDTNHHGLTKKGALGRESLNGGLWSESFHRFLFFDKSGAHVKRRDMGLSTLFRA